MPGTDFCIGRAEEPKGRANIHKDKGHVANCIGDPQRERGHRSADFICQELHGMTSHALLHIAFLTAAQVSNS